MTESMTRRSGWGLVFWLAVTFAAAVVGSRFMPGEWYAGLHKPSWTPPGWVFAPVWTALYLLMATAAWLVWRQRGFRAAQTALVLYLVQLACNAAWSWLFFGRHDIALAFGDIVALWLLILATTVLFWRRSRVAGACLVPYLLWVSYAATLNYELLRLNG